MDRKRVVVIGFGSFLVVAVAVLGYGLWRKGDDAREARQRVAAADRLLSMSLADFVRQTPAEQTRRLVEARTVKQALEASQADGSDEKAEELGQWTAKHLALRVAVQWKRWQMAQLREQLRYGAPAPGGTGPCRQVSSARAQRIRVAAKRADELAGGLTAEVGGQRVDLSPALGEAAQRVQAEARRAVMELDRREAAFSKYVAAVQQAIADRRSDDVRKLGADLDKWLAMAAGVAEKKRRLAALASHLAGAGGGDEEKTLLSRMDGLFGVLASSTSAKEIRVALGQCDDVIKSAGAFVNRRPGSPVKTKLQSLLAAKAAAPARTRDLTAQARLGANKQDTIEYRVLYRTLVLANARTRPTDLAEWQRAATPIRKAIAEVEAVDSDAAFLGMLLDATKRPITTGSTAGASTPVRWVGPRWELFDANLKALKELLAQCERHGIRRHYWPFTKWQDHDYTKYVVLQFAQMHGRIKKYIDAFEKFKRDHDARVATKQAEEEAKKPKSLLPKDHGRKTIFDH